MSRMTLLPALVGLIAIACVPAASPGPMPDQQMITEPEIVGAHANSAYDVIHKLRANFLSARGQTSILLATSSYPTVYVDGQRYGDIDALRIIPARDVASIRLYRAWDATTRFGTGNTNGVIAITTRLDRR
jgi:hypothetical protein